VTKSSESEQARRVNATVRLLREKASPQEVLSWLITHYGISRRQAYRYLLQAQTVPGPLPVPEAKVVFTVKLPVSVIQHVRQRSQREGLTISQWVERALQRSLSPRKGHG
jgi:hypothetical protein